MKGVILSSWFTNPEDLLVVGVKLVTARGSTNIYCIDCVSETNPYYFDFKKIKEWTLERLTTKDWWAVCDFCKTAFI